jgi:hypothetical protein
MAERDISIGIKTTADTAAVKQAEVALEGLENQARQTDAALDGVASSAGSSLSAGGSRRGKGAAAAIKEIADEAPKAAAGTRNFGSAVGQVGFQVQDFAVQVGGGTSALTAFAQQGSQLLGIFGPGGAIAGALLAVGAIAFKYFQESKEGGEDAAASAEELAAALEKVREKAAAAEAARESQSLATFAEALDAEAEGYRRLNDEVAKNISLMQARRRAQAEVDSASAALDLARIDADPNLSEEEKIQRRAEVQERIEQQKLQGRIAGIGERVAQSQAEVETRRGAVKEASDANDKAQLELERARREREELEPRVSARRQLRGAEDEYGSALEKVREFEEAGEFQDGKKLRPTVKAADDRLKAARERLEEIKGIVASEDEVTRFLALEKEVIKEREAEAAKRLKAEQEARDALKTAVDKRDQVVTDAGIETEGAVNAFEIGRQTRGVGTAARVRTAQEQERERREAETARARQRQQAEAARREGLGREGEGIADGVARGASDPRQSAALEQIGNRIAADPAGGGLDQLTSAIERLLTTADQTRARELRRALERIERLEAKVKKGGDNP